MNWKAAGIFVGMLALGAEAVFAGQNPGPGGRGPMGPPPEAYEACKDKNEGDSVVVTTPRGDTLKAVCKMINNKLAAIPENMPAPPSGSNPGN